MGELLHYVRGLIYLYNSLMQVYDMDSVLLHEDVRSHFGIPFSLQVTEVNTCIK